MAANNIAKLVENIANAGLWGTKNFTNYFRKEKTRSLSTWPRRSSARTQPADHISIEVVYSVAPNMSSGAR